MAPELRQMHNLRDSERHMSRDGTDDIAAHRDRNERYLAYNSLSSVSQRIARKTNHGRDMQDNLSGFSNPIISHCNAFWLRYINNERMTVEEISEVSHHLTLSSRRSRNFKDMMGRTERWTRCSGPRVQVAIEPNTC